jgi:hypothetical protein
MASGMVERLNDGRTALQAAPASDRCLRVVNKSADVEDGRGAGGRRGGSLDVNSAVP